ncbi:queuine tRNA-ribosyltransferase tRNA-guanine transglycosylase [Halospeciosus flavus]|uniref:Queuine tRNA-ribosyltransferase tRNA-guanine transglycosylase n=1 Tax=Halospeciosus flavus TaxID=3032283 RepID=A0ABD5YY82_9EURY|nr:queuine tRNA-ribosyltransferase tRNA-guanine transglycosylase [Halospeciosus flavus]
MRFYVPEWDDAVDAHYDFEHDELSSLNRKERNLDYIWDIFDRETTPIDGVLISREQVEETDRKAERLAEYGVYDDPVLSVPDWLPTISDCGAWGYKSLPFPPYGNKDMLDFYETLEVSVGVTIDHLVLGSGKDKGRLYLDKRAFHEDFKKGDIPDSLSDVVDVMVDEWPEEWPDYVGEYEPSIRTEQTENITNFTASDFHGDIDVVLRRLAEDRRAVYRENDEKFRYELTLHNAEEMYDLYQNGDYPFRLMVAIQGWDPKSYIKAANKVLDLGYDYLGIGGVAGSPIHEVRKIVKGVGKTVKSFERENSTRVDSHVFGFAKTDGFETIGRSGMTSFDSASMLRSAWTGGDNYQLDSEERYDAIRIRYPSNTDSLDEAIEKSLRGREALVALRAYGSEYPLIEAIDKWHQKAEKVLPAAREYLQEHRHDPRYDKSLLREVESAFRNDFEYGRELQASFSDRLRSRIVKLLRKDDPEAPIPFEEYEELLRTAERELEAFPRMLDQLKLEEAISNIGRDESPGGDTDTDASSQRLDGEDEEPGLSLYDQIWMVVKDYANWIGDDHLLEEYQETLRNRPWETCECRICEKHGIEVCVFRGNDRNRRRGFHNTRRFYDQFAEELPKILVATKGTASLSGYETIKDYLQDKHSDFWEQVHDLPVAEIGTLHGDGVQEWWNETPSLVSFSPDRIAEAIGDQTERYQHLFLLTQDGEISPKLRTVSRKTTVNSSYSMTPKSCVKACSRRVAETIPSARTLCRTHRQSTPAMVLTFSSSTSVQGQKRFRMMLPFSTKQRL